MLVPGERFDILLAVLSRARLVLGHRLEVQVVVILAYNILSHWHNASIARQTAELLQIYKNFVKRPRPAPPFNEF